MKRILMIANTYYQLIIAVRLSSTLFCSDSVDIILSNHSNGMKEIVENVKESGVFNCVVFVETKGNVENRNIIERMKDFIEISFCRKNRYCQYLKDIDNKIYDELISFNQQIDLYGIYSYLSYFNCQIVVSQFEEGIISYSKRYANSKGRKCIDLIRRLQHKRSLKSVFKNFYCFYPQLYDGELYAVQVPAIKIDSECSGALRKIFSVIPEKLNYHQKYIFFSTTFDFEGGAPIGELELALSIANLVGIDNMLVKIHPRDTRNIYKKHGFTVDENSNIPWEVIQLSMDFSDKVFLTTTSNSVLAGSFMSEKKVRTCFLYKLCKIKDNKIATRVSNNIDELASNNTIMDILEKVTIIEKIEDIIK